MFRKPCAAGIVAVGIILAGVLPGPRSRRAALDRISPLSTITWHTRQLLRQRPGRESRST